MAKDKHISSELHTFFHKNDCNRAINCIMTTIRHLNLRSSYIGIEKRHNSKLTCLQVLEHSRVTVRKAKIQKRSTG